MVLLELYMCNCGLVVCWSQGLVNSTKLVANGAFDKLKLVVVCEEEKKLSETKNKFTNPL